MGGVRKSVKKLKIVKVFPEQNVILVSGSVPGNVKSIITVEKV
jgi:large subunit ribosomal protein L3